MKTIEEAKNECRSRYANDSLNILGVSDGAFQKGIEFAQRWISISEQKPENISYKTISANNMNRHLHGIKYVLKGYYNNNESNIGYEVGEWFPSSICYYFVTKNNFTVTHWRPIEIK